MKKLGIVITQGQPIDLNTETLIRRASSETDALLILVGSTNRALDCMRPFSFKQIKSMISIIGIEKPYYIKPLNDTLYNDAAWSGQVHTEVSEIKDHMVDGISIGENQTVKPYKDSVTVILYTHSKLIADDYPTFSSVVDSSLKPTQNEILEAFYENDNQYLKDNLSHEIYLYIHVTMDSSGSNARHANNMRYEYEYIKEYKESWNNAPYQPTFVTTDAVVYFRGYVLLVKRKANPGKGLWALPGGFINQYEQVETSLIRELKEETRIKVAAPILKSNIRNIQVFSDPYRSLRGRTITHAGLIVLDGVTSIQSLPKVRGADDAEVAKWFSLSEIEGMSDKLFEDHYFIIKKMLHVS